MRKRNLIIILCVLIGVLLIGFLWIRDAVEKPVIIQDKMDVKKPIISGQTFYVSVDGNDGFDGLSQVTAFATMQQALHIMQPGDGLIIADGIYMQDLVTVRNGTHDRPIVIMGSKNAIVQGTGKKARIIEINHDFIMLYGFTVDGLVGKPDRVESYRDKLIYMEGKDLQEGVEGVLIADMHLKNAGGECVRVKYFSHHNEFTDNTITGCGAYDFLFKGKGKNGEGIYIGTAPEQVEDDKNISRDVDQSHHNWIHDNRIDTQGNECVDVKEGSSYNVIENNVCTGQKDKESAGLDSRGNQNIFKNNEVYGCLGAGIRLGGDKDDDGINNDVIGNYLHNNASGGIKVQTKPQGEICENMITNNKKGDFVGEYGDDMQNKKKCL